MSPVTRVELNARLETIEVRLDGRIAALESSVKDVQNSIGNLKSTILWNRKRTNRLKAEPPAGG